MSASWLAVVLVLAGGPREQHEATTIAVRALKDPFNEDSFKTYLATLPRFEELYVFEGDVLATEKEIRGHLVANGAQWSSVSLGSELLVNVVAGEPDYWRDRAKRRMTYAVDRASFGDDTAQYRRVIEDLAAAARDWMQSCSTCGLEFVHLPAHDGAPSHDKVGFIVRKVDSKGAFLASSFFPSYGLDRRYLNVDKTLFSTRFDRVGVLRHELGHILGYRHEHIVGVRGCFRESGSWRPLTPYDPRSVMHYFCGGGGSLKLLLTDLDRKGHRKLYGGL